MTGVPRSNSSSRAGIWFIGTCTTSGMRASCTSQSSRTSTTSGFSPRSRAALSSSTEISRIIARRSELEALGARGVLQRVDARFEQAGARELAIGLARDQQGFLRLALPDHDEQLSTRRQRAGKPFVVQGQGTTYRNHRIVFSRIQVESVTRDDVDLPEPGPLEVGACGGGELGLDFDGADARTHRRQARRHETGAAADHQRAHPRTGIESLKESSDNFRRQHVLTFRQRDVRVGEREIRVALGHEKFARRATHRVEHAFVEHVPRADLLRDHLAARELRLHEQLLDWDATYSARKHDAEVLRLGVEPVVTSLIFMVNVAWAVASLG